MKGNLSYQIQMFLVGHLIKKFHVYEIFGKCDIVLTTKPRRNTSLATIT